MVADKSINKANAIEDRAPLNMVAVIERAAINPDVGINKMQQLLDMQERIMAKNAEAAFNQAMAKLQPEMPVIERSAKGHNSKYAKYEDIDEQLRPLYTAHGFSVSFTSRKDGQDVIYFGTLRHVDGHAEIAQIDLPADSGGSKNAIQAKASTMTYAKRYLLTMLLNVVTKDEDDDGDRGGATVLDNEIAAGIDQRINELPDAAEYKPKFLSYMKVKAVNDIRARDLQKAEIALKAKEAGAK